MGCEVYANGDEIACKAGDGKVIAASPDVCLTPPPPPAGPVPVPYADTSFSKDMQQGSKTVMIKNKEVMLKDQSFYKTSPLGNEAATNGQGASVVTHVITGKTYFIAWSMDVKFEGQNVDRHSDMTTSNHASPMGATPPFKNEAAEAKKTNDFATKTIKECAPDAHTWACGKAKCAQCWVPDCPDNAKKENDAYDEEQAKPKEERIKNQTDKLEAEMKEQMAMADMHKGMMKSRQDLIASGMATAASLPAARSGIAKHRELMNAHEAAANGKQAEIDAVKKHANDLEHAGYLAHCTTCHRTQEIDVVTKDVVAEVKYEAHAHDLGQMKKIDSVNKACFKGKQTVAMVPANEVKAMEDKLAKWGKGDAASKSLASATKVMDP